MPGSVNASGLIAPQKVQLLLDIIQNSSIIDDGLTACGLEFSSLFQTRAERFKARCWITNVLTKSALKAVKQRLVALFLLQCDYACDARSLPFLHVFLQILRTAAEGGAEARFINQLLQLNADEAQACTESYNKALDPRTPLNCPVPTNLKEGLATEAGSHTTSSKVQVKGSVRTATAGSSVAPVLCTSGPRFARPMPPLMQPLQEETCPVLPSIADSLLWDDSSEVSPSQVAAIQQQLAEAQCKPLQPLQHKELILALDSWPRIVHHIGFCPAQLPALVEHNNLIAVELLLKLMSTNSPRVNAFLGALIHMDLSVHAMEVVKTLTSAATLPEDFIHRYIHACIAACEAIEQRSQKQQNRPVRLVCVFLQSLINTKIVDVKAIQFEVPPFCIKFSRIREAAVLYKMIHQ